MGELTGENQKMLEDELEKLVAKHYPHLKKAEEAAEEKEAAAESEPLPEEE